MNIGKYFRTDKTYHILEAPLRFVNKLIMSMYPAKYMAEVTVNIVCVVDAYVVCSWEENGYYSDKNETIQLPHRNSYFRTEGHGFNWASSIVSA